MARETEWSVCQASPDPTTWASAAYQADDWSGSPAECDVSIRPGWFYHASQDAKVKSLAHLLDIYYQSVGRNSVLLLNIPPDRRGLFHENDARRLRELRQVLDETFRDEPRPRQTGQASNVRAAAIRPAAPTRSWTATRPATGPPTTARGSASLEIDLGTAVTFNRSMVQEQIALGQRIEEYALEAWDGKAWRPFAKGTTIGYKKLDRFPDVTASRVRLTIGRSRAFPAIREFGLFRESPARK